MTIDSLSMTKPQGFLKPLPLRSFLKTATVTCLGLALAGCFGTQTKVNPDVAYQYQPKYSRALNLMLATGTMVEGGEIVDAEVQRPEGSGDVAVTYQEGRESLDNFSDTLNMVSGSMVLSGAWAPPAGVSSGFHGGMMLLSLLDSPYKPSFVSDHLVAFMPSKLAASEEEAAALLESMMSEAIAKSVPDDTHYEVYEHHWKPTFGSPTISKIGVLSGGVCNKSEVEFNGPGDQPIKTGCRVFLRAEKDPVHMKAPNWMEDEDVYLFRPDLYKDRNSSRGSLSYYLGIEPQNVDGILDSIAAKMDIEQDLGDLKRDRLLLRMTEHLPDWFYVYVAPKKDDPVPKIYQQGNVLYFAKYVDQ